LEKRFTPFCIVSSPGCVVCRAGKDVPSIQCKNKKIFFYI
jgi:hypothetical protein